MVNVVTEQTDAPQSGPVAEGQAVYEWAPAEPKKRKRHGGLWAGGVAVVAIAALVAASLVLIAPGTAIAGVQVGGLTPGAAAEAVQSRLSQTQVVLTGAGDDAIVTGAQLGAHVDAKALADAAYSERPMWNPTAWFSSPSDAPITVDADAATAALRKAVPSVYRDPVEATLAYDSAKHAYVTTASTDGTGLDIAAVTTALEKAFASGEGTVDLAATQVSVAPKTTTATAQAGADMLNGMISNAGFYVGKERTVEVDPDTLASWLKVSTDDRGAVTVTADTAAIQKTVDGLAAKVNRKVSPTTVIADANGNVLKTLKKGASGRTLGDTAGIAAAFAAQLQSGNAVYALPVTEEKPAVTTVSRAVEVDLSQQRAYLRENGKVIDSFLVSTGRPGHETHTGTFRIVAKLTKQNMGNPDLSQAPNYYTKDVPWVMYFNGDQALHGAYWHHNFGHVMSHGCVNLPVNVAKRVFEWAPVGTTVWVHN